MTASIAKSLEGDRLNLQLRLDQAKTQAERNRLGQFATPTGLAGDLLQYAHGLLPPDKRIRFLDPAFGTGAFYSALLRVFPRERIVEARGFEIDLHYGDPTAQFWAQHGLALNLEDFTQVHAEPRFDLVICNPPYVRHHHLATAEKARLHQRSSGSAGMKLSGLSGLYCHFLGLSHAWMADSAVAGWLVPSEFMDVNYGREVKKYLLERVTLLPSTAPTIADFFRIKRGLATGDNSYFILPPSEIEARGLPISEFRPILPSPRYLTEDVVHADDDGNPKIDRLLFLLDTSLSEDEIGMYPTPLLAAAMEEDPHLMRRVWSVLNEISPHGLLGEGRVYGGGLHKLEPRELGNVRVPQLLDVLQARQRPMQQPDLFSAKRAA